MSRISCTRNSIKPGWTILVEFPHTGYFVVRFSINFVVKTFYVIIIIIIIIVAVVIT